MVTGSHFWIENWFNLVQTVGIMGSLWMAASAAHREAKAREIENLLTISEQHREVWSELIKNAELQRVVQADADVTAKPPTLREEEIINMVMIHFLKSWRIAKIGGLITLKELETDVRHFFRLPLPSVVWEKTKEARNRKFVRFVKRALEPDGRL